MSAESHDHGGRARRTRRRVRVASLAPILIAVCLVAAACGGGGTPAAGVASVGKSTATTDPPAAGGGGGTGGGSKSSKYAAALAYSQCMRSHGIANFPDPSADGGIEIQGGPNSSSGPNPGSAAFKAADQACRHLLPNGGQPTAAQKQQFLSQALKFSQCMRSHGFPNFPDPSTTGGGVSLKITPSSGIKPSSPQFRAAQKACSSFLPGWAQRGSAPGQGSGFKVGFAG